MPFRITTNGVFRNYRSHLTQNSQNLNSAMTRVQTERKFNSYAEDPAAASQSFQMRRAYWRAGDQIDNLTHVTNKFSTAWDIMDSIVDGDSLDSMRESLTALNGTAGGSRSVLGVELQTVAGSLVEIMNTRYGDEFVFAGADGLNVPFSVSKDGKLQYRGVDVDSSSQADLDKLSAMTQEATYVDIGLGFKLNDAGEVIPSSAFNSSLSGISFLGYGTDEDGDPKNLISLMQELGGILANCDKNTGKYAEDEDEDKALRLAMKLHDSIANVMEQHTDLDAKVRYLKNSKNQLEITRDRMNEQIVDLEHLDPAEAILDMNWAQYCYNASLKIGTTLLSQSLIDYMS